MNTPNFYSHVDDAHDLELVASLVTVNCKHTFNADELAEESQALALAANEKTHIEAEKKVVVADYGNKIKTLDGQIKLHAGHVASGFTYKDKPAEMYRDYENLRRVYFAKDSGNFIKDEPFHESDYQHKLVFDATKEQIEANNDAGDYAEGGDNAIDALDEVIIAKKVKGRKGAKNKPDEGEVPEGMFIDLDDNLTDYRPVG